MKTKKAKEAKFPDGYPGTKSQRHTAYRHRMRRGDKPPTQRDVDRVIAAQARRDRRGVRPD